MVVTEGVYFRSHYRPLSSYLQHGLEEIRVLFPFMTNLESLSVQFVQLGQIQIESAL